VLVDFVSWHYGGDAWHGILCCSGFLVQQGLQLPPDLDGMMPLLLQASGWCWQVLACTTSS
jgi:hypothetical protein